MLDENWRHGGVRKGHIPKQKVLHIAHPNLGLFATSTNYPGLGFTAGRMPP